MCEKGVAGQFDGKKRVNLHNTKTAGEIWTQSTKQSYYLLLPKNTDKKRTPKQLPNNPPPATYRH